MFTSSGGSIFENLNELARRAMGRAMQEALCRKHRVITDLHFLLAVINLDDCLCCRVLERLGLDLGELEGELAEWLKALPADATPGSPLSLSLRFRRVIWEARVLGSIGGQSFATTEDLLRAIVNYPASPAGMLLRDYGITLRNLEAALSRPGLALRRADDFSRVIG